MTKIDDGGPAFPLNVHPSHLENVIPGMTLRDWFAGMAMQGITSGDYFDAEYARRAFEMADAMLRERGKEEGK